MKARVTLKLAIVFVLTIVILIALLAVGITIDSRENYRKEAVKAISQSYAGAQTVIGPAISRHYLYEEQVTNTSEKGAPSVKMERRGAWDYVFPSTLTMTGEMVPSERRHGLYRVTVYELRAHIEESFNLEANPLRTYDEAQLRLVLSDVRGIVGLPQVRVNGVPILLAQNGTVQMSDGERRTSLTAPHALEKANGPLKVSVDLVLAGTQQLRIAPVGDINRVALRSTWASPLFAGAFLPRTRSVNASGFNAEWEVSSLASSAQTQAHESSMMGAVDTFDVTLNQPADPYTLSERATKYGVLFVLLTFGGFFIFEVLKQLPIHPVQYLLVGFALALFFLLLISLSEHIPFGWAYLLSGAASIGLLTFYLTYALRGLQRGLAFGAMFTLLFGVIYALLLSEDNALLLGSLMLFAILTAVMAVTRKVDWYGRDGLPPTNDVSPSHTAGNGFSVAE